MGVGHPCGESCSTAADGRPRPIPLTRRDRSTVMNRSRTSTSKPVDSHPIDSAILASVTTLLLLVVLHALLS
jgi:hypothetical protein